MVAVGKDLYYLELNAEAGSEKIVEIRLVSEMVKDKDIRLSLFLIKFDVSRQNFDTF